MVQFLFLLRIQIEIAGIKSKILKLYGFFNEFDQYYYNFVPQFKH